MAKTVVIYAGGFQPFHIGHLSSYLQAKKAFPDADFYVAASGDVKTRPIPFNDKKFLATQAGVDPSDFPDIVVKSPLNPKEILSKYNPNEDIFVLVRSERDPMSYTKKDGTPGYYQPWKGYKDAQPFGKHAYVFVTKKQDFNINGQEVYSGTQVRDMYSNGDDKARVNIVKQLYPNSKKQKTIKGLLDKYIGNNMNEDIQNLINKVKPLINESTPAQKVKLLKLLEAAKKKMEAANPAQQAAIAINMKKKGKKPKSEVKENIDYLPEK